MSTPTIIAVGELLVEFVSHQTGCALRELADYSGPYPSGAPAICIDQSAKTGAHAALFGALGNDSFGDSLVERLKSDGVDTSHIIRVDNKTTGVAFVSYFDDGTRTFIFHLTNTAVDAFSPTDIQLPAGPLLMHISGSSLGNAPLRQAIDLAVDTVLARGGEISCDPNARAELMQDPAVRSSLMSIMRRSTYLFPSTSDLEYLFPEKSEQEALTEMQSYGAQCVVLKRGKHGAIIFSDETQFALNGHCVDEIDPTGAGDCFCGTFLSMITQGFSLHEAGRYANAAGALAVTRRGPMEGNSDMQTLRGFLEKSEAVSTGIEDDSSD